MYRRSQPGMIRLVDVTVVALVALLAGSGQVLAQLDDTPGNTNTPLIAEPAVPPGTDSIVAPPESSAIPDAPNGEGVDDAVASPVPDADVEPLPASATADADETSSSSSENGAVLEIPQVIRLRDTGEDITTDQASANSNDDDQTALAGQDGASAGNQELRAMSGQVGTLTDYQNQAIEAPPRAIFFAPGAAIVRWPPAVVLSPLPRIRVPTATAPIILPPTSSGPFPSTSPMLMPTSPMLMTPRLATFGLFRGGSFRRGHR